MGSCCDPREICSLHTCGTGLKLKSNHATILCAGASCASSDDGECCTDDEVGSGDPNANNEGGGSSIGIVLGILIPLIVIGAAIGLYFWMQANKGDGSTNDFTNTGT